MKNSDAAVKEIFLIVRLIENLKGMTKMARTNLTYFVDDGGGIAG
jgi:hypothetical protein